MLQVETLPQSMVDIKTIILKPRLDQGEIRAMGERLKQHLFSKFGFKPKPEDVRLLASEEYFEPYFLIGGKYVLDYCKKHVIEAEVDKKTTKVFVAGQEVNSKESDPKTKKRVLEITGEEHVHYEKKGYFVLDRMNREVAPERIPLSPFVVRGKSSDLNHLFKKTHISDEKQIAFLKEKIAQRPDDVAEIMKEIYEITDRMIAYYPMYLLSFENAKKRTEATISVDGITGETSLNETRKLDSRTISTSQDEQAIVIQFTENIEQEEMKVEEQIESVANVVPSVPKEEEKIHSKEDQITESQPPMQVVCKEAMAEPAADVVHVIANIDPEVSSENVHVIDSQPVVGGDMQIEPVRHVTSSVARDKVEIPENENVIIEPKPPEPTVDEKSSDEHVADLVPPVPNSNITDGSEDSQPVQATQSEKSDSLQQEPSEPILYVLPPGLADNSQETTKATIPSDQPDETVGNERTILGFPARILGEVVDIDENVTTVVGDVEIPSGTNINRNLVVKGSLKIGDNCRGHAQLKALKDITIGADTVIDGNLISGGNIFVGPRSLINGSVEASGILEIEKDAVVDTGRTQTSTSQKQNCLDCEIDLPI